MLDEHLDKSKEFLNEIKELQVVKNAHSRIEDLEQSIIDLQKTGLNVADVEAVVKDARNALEADDLKAVNIKAIKAEDLINDARDKYLSGELQNKADSLWSECLDT